MTTPDDIISGVDGILWPQLFGGDAATILALICQLDETQMLPPEEIKRGQHQQLAAMLEHTQHYSDYVARILKEAGLTARDLQKPENLGKLPIMSRRALLTQSAAINCHAVPQEHTPLNKTSTSGSTGEPVYVMRTAITSRYWLAHTMRDHLWHERDLTGTLAIIRGNLAPGASPDHPSWGIPTNIFFQTGSAHILPVNTDIAGQVAWLQKIKPASILTYPNNVAALIEHLHELPFVKEFRTTGETVSPQLRAKCPIPITDIYSSQEFGNIALQCPQSGAYHVMAENLIVEVLREDGTPCREGETGRIIITDLSNVATPLIRYDIRDYAEVGGPCSCGRGLPTLRHIAGRERNMLVGGKTRRWPLLRDSLFRDAAPILQYQVIQKSQSDIEMRLVCSRAPTEQEEEVLRQALQKTLEFAFAITFVYFDEELPKSASGKREDFISEVKYEI